MINDSIKVKGNVKIYSFPADKIPDIKSFEKLTKNELEQYLIEDGHNLVVNVGLLSLSQYITGQATTLPGFIEVGTSSTAVINTDSALVAALTPRETCYAKYAVNGDMHFDAFFLPADAVGTWAEAGLFTALTGGTMIARKILTSTFVKTTGNTAIVMWTITVTAS